MEMLYSLDPVSKTAGIVTSQNGCTNTVYLDYNGVKEVLKTVRKRRAELVAKLGYSRNRLRNRLNGRNVRHYDFAPGEKDIFMEILDNGYQINILSLILKDLK